MILWYSMVRTAVKVTRYDAVELGGLVRPWGDEDARFVLKNKVHVNAMFLGSLRMQVSLGHGETHKMEVSRVKDHHPAWSRSSAIPQSRGSDQQMGSHPLKLFLCPTTTRCRPLSGQAPFLPSFSKVVPLSMTCLRATRGLHGGGATLATKSCGPGRIVASLPTVESFC